MGVAMERSNELERFVESWFEAASRGDTSLVERHLSNDHRSRLIGSDPDEWLRGADDITQFLRGEVEGAAGAVTFSPSETEAYCDGSVGWAATKLQITRPDGMHVSPRWTAVFVREGDTWQVVQTHASIAIPNAEVGWTYE
jgi:ketosteroid isomerase-like protein